MLINSNKSKNLTRRSPKQDVSENGKAVTSSPSKKGQRSTKGKRTISPLPEELPITHSTHGRVKDTEDPTLVLSPSDEQCQCGLLNPHDCPQDSHEETYSSSSTSKKKKKNIQRTYPSMYTDSGERKCGNEKMVFVPVVDMNNKPLMPTTPARARKWIKSRKATYFFVKGMFCVRLNVQPSGNFVQEIPRAVDPGSCKEAFTAKSAAHTYINIEADAIDSHSIKKDMINRKSFRNNRRQRNTPYRKNRTNRSGNKNFIPPSIKARWQLKANVLNFLNRLFPPGPIIVEDVKAKTKEGDKNWNSNFSAIECGKNWFYNEVRKLGELILIEGHETARLRDELNLGKDPKKTSGRFESQCQDSWVMANSISGGHTKPDNIKIWYISSIKVHRRQLHVANFAKGGKRRCYGGGSSYGIRRGSLVWHKELGLCYVGGNSKKKITLHNIETGERVTQKASIKDIKFLSYNSWKFSNRIEKERKVVKSKSKSKSKSKTGGAIPPTTEVVGFLCA